MKQTSDNIRVLLIRTGKRQKDLADFMGMSPQTLANKFSRGSWSDADLIKVSAFCNAPLGFDAPGEKILLDLPEISGKEKESL